MDYFVGMTRETGSSFGSLLTYFPSPRTREARVERLGWEDAKLVNYFVEEIEVAVKELAC